jgi:hypothetical protein
VCWIVSVGLAEISLGHTLRMSLAQCYHLSRQLCDETVQFTSTMNLARQTQSKGTFKINRVIPIDRSDTSTIYRRDRVILSAFVAFGEQKAYSGDRLDSCPTGNQLRIEGVNSKYLQPSLLPHMSILQTCLTFTMFRLEDRLDCTHHLPYCRTSLAVRRA